MARLRVGLLGGSFNPAHDGHRHISLIALRALRLDQVWWLVSPQNPLKSSTGMAPSQARLSRARQVAAHPRIFVSDVERRLGTRYTCDTITALKQRFANVDFVWLMGADNLIEIPRWRRWTDIFRDVHVAVIDRPTYSYKALAAQAAQRFRAHRVRSPGSLLERQPPAWCFIRSRGHEASATAIRASDDWPT